MKVKDLIEELKAYDPETEVRIAQPTHDHWRSTLAAEITAIERLPIKHSDYHNNMVLGDDEDYESEDFREALVLY